MFEPGVLQERKCPSWSGLKQGVVYLSSRPCCRETTRDCSPKGKLQRCCRRIENNCWLAKPQMSTTMTQKLKHLSRVSAFLLLILLSYWRHFFKLLCSLHLGKGSRRLLAMYSRLALNSLQYIAQVGLNSQ